MANLHSIARPYALAAFDYAQEQQQLPAWKDFLETAARVARDKQVIAMMRNPEVYAPRQVELFSEVLSSIMDEHKKNFLKLLAMHGRLAVLPEVSETFNTYYAALEKVAKVNVVTAVEIDGAYKQKLSQALAHKLQRDVVLNCIVDPAVIGGAVIHIGDRVIDGSVRGKLNRMLENLTG